MLVLLITKPIFALGMLTIMCSTQSTKRDTLLKIKRILMDLETAFNQPESSMNSKGYREAVKREVIDTYPCKEIKEEVSVAELVRRTSKAQRNGHNNKKYDPPTVVTFKCEHPGSFCKPNCRCSQRYRQVYFQERMHGVSCREWKLIPLKIYDGCHCHSNR